MTDKVIFVTATGNWQVPQDWNILANKVECLGPGGRGSAGAGAASGAGGGGPAYAKLTNISLVPGALVPVVVEVGSDTDFNSQAIAKKGGDASGATHGAGALASACTPTTGAHSGGDGGDGIASGGVNRTGGSAGGPAGPTGDGTNGTIGVASNSTSIAASAAGTPGTGSWTSNPGAVTASPGTPGAGSSITSNVPSTGGDGTLYGAPSGGGANANGGTTAAGAAKVGIIVITYTPATTPASQAVNRTTNTNLRARGRAPRARFFIHGAIASLRAHRLLPYHLLPVTHWLPPAGPTKFRNTAPKLQRVRATDPLLEE